MVAPIAPTIYVERVVQGQMMFDGHPSESGFNRDALRRMGVLDRAIVVGIIAASQPLSLALSHRGDRRLASDLTSRAMRRQRTT